MANDGMENYLYRNNGNGTFEEIALRTGTAFGQNGEATSAMGPEFGDYDGDGLYRSAGSPTWCTAVSTATPARGSSRRKSAADGYRRGAWPVHQLVGELPRL